MTYVRRPPPRHAFVSVAPGACLPRRVFLVTCGMATPLHSYGRRIGVTVRTLHGRAARPHLAVAVTTLSPCGGRPPDLDRSIAHLRAPARSECGRAFPPESELIPPAYVRHRVHFSLMFSRRRMQAAGPAVTWDSTVRS
jgi:hypothetical protein